MGPVSWLFLPSVLVFSLVQSVYFDLSALSRMRRGFGLVHYQR
jgi:hypothetical protein